VEIIMIVISTSAILPKVVGILETMEVVGVFQTVGVTSGSNPNSDSNGSIPNNGSNESIVNNESQNSISLPRASSNDELNLMLRIRLMDVLYANFQPV